MIYKIGIHENVPSLEKGRNELLDVYYPADAKPDEKFPGVVIIHGGGWTGGQRDAAREINIASNLVRMGYVCVSIDYVLSQKGKGTWPRNFQDCKTAVQWMRVNAEKLHLIPDKIGCIGGSAGGHLSTLLAVGGKDMGLEPTSPYGGVDTSIQAGVNLYGIMDLTKNAWQFFEFEMRAVGADPTVFSRWAVGKFEDCEIKSGTGLNAEAHIQNGPVVIRFQRNWFHGRHLHSVIPFHRQDDFEAFSCGPCFVVRHLRTDADFHGTAPLAVVLHHDVCVFFQRGGHDAVWCEDFKRLAVGVCNHHAFKCFRKIRLFFVAKLV